MSMQAAVPAHSGRLASAAILAVLIAALLCDMIFIVIYISRSPMVVSAGMILVDIVCVAMAVWRKLPLSTRAVVAVGISVVATTGLGAFADLAGWAGLGEITALLVLTAEVLRWAPRWQATVLAGALIAALVVFPLRGERLFWPGLIPLFVGAAAVAVGIGLFWRWRDAVRRERHRAIQQAVRLDLARDLHDFVAHHVTGIVVQAQAARFTATTGHDVDSTLANIEEAGSQALTSMRELVAILREDGDVRKPCDLADLDSLVTPFTGTGPPVTVTIEPVAATGDLAPQVSTSIYRIVQESLTNTRRHAPTATGIEVTITSDGGSVTVTVRDDGPPQPTWHGHGGFGLVGLAERVTALGGHLAAGPHPEGGWQVRADIPTRRRRG